jgi:pantoate--beta-alanine ligase
MYPSPQQAFVEVARVADKLEGEFRPGHFRGVATVVLKLFHIVQPDRAYFGEKDAQQLAVIRRMVADLNLPVEIVAVPTLRETDGLAMSSRNRLLSPPERRVAPVLYEALRTAGGAVAAGVTDAAEVRRRALAVLAREPGMRIEYLEVADPDGMQPVGLIGGPALVVAAVWLGNTRLIDNLLCRPL